MFLQRLFDGFRSDGCPALMLALVLGVAAGSAQAQEGREWHPQPEIAALSAVLMNPATGEILFAKEPHLRLPPASTTKVLTALVALEHLDPNARVLVSPQAASAPPSRIGLRAGEAALTQDLLYGLMLKSGNDAAETLAEAAGGSVAGFAELMNAKAVQIGAHDSHFMNPHGLPNDDHYTTAHDLALIFRQAINHPLFADIVRTRSAALRIESSNGLYGDWRMVPVQTHNRLLGSYEGTLGGKTGFTFKARRCFVGEVDRGGVRLIVAILNSPHSGALWQDARRLLDYGFAHYGLAAPPPVPAEPILVLARRTPVAAPDDDDEKEPAAHSVVARLITPVPQQRPSMVRSLQPAKPTAVATRTPKAVKAPVAPVAVRPVAPRPVATVAVKPAKPLVLAAMKPVNTPSKIATKPTVAMLKVADKPPVKPTPVVAAKSEKREVAKVAVHAEPAVKPQKPKR